MTTHKRNVPNYGNNSPSDYFTFPTWRSWFRYPENMVVGSEVKNPFSKDSDYTVTVPSYTYTTTKTETYTVPGGVVIETKNLSSPGSFTLTWDSDSKSWLNVPANFTGLFSDNGKFRPTINQPAPQGVPWPQRVNVNFLGGQLNFNTATRKLSGYSNQHAMCFNDDGLFDAYGDGTAAWVFLFSNTVTFADKGKTRNSQYARGVVTTTKLNIIDDTTVSTVLKNVTLYEVHSWRYGLHQEGYYPARLGTQGEFFDWNPDSEIFTNILPLYFDGAIRAPNNVDYFYIDGKSKGTSTTQSNYEVQTHRTDLPQITIRHYQTKAVLKKDYLYDWHTKDGSRLTLTDYAYTEYTTWPIKEIWYYIYENGQLFSSWRDFGINKSSYNGTWSPTKFFPNYGQSNYTDLTLRSVNANGTTKDSEVTDFFGARKISISQGGTTATRTVTVTVLQPARDITITKDDKLHSFWVSLQENEGKNPADSENSPYWRLFYDTAYDNIVYELEGVLRYFNDSDKKALANVNWAPLIAKMKDSDSDVRVKYYMLDSDYTAVRALVDSELMPEKVIEKRIDSELTGFTLKNFILDIKSVIDSDNPAHLLFKQYIEGLITKEKTDKDSDVAALNVLRNIGRTLYAGDSDIIQLIKNYPKQVLTQSFKDGAVVASKAFMVTELQKWLDSDLPSFDSESLFPLIINNRAKLDSEYFSRFESDMLATIDSDLAKATAVPVDFNGKVFTNGLGLKSNIVVQRGVTKRTTTSEPSLLFDFVDSEFSHHGQVLFISDAGATEFFEYVYATNNVTSGVTVINSYRSGIQLGYISTTETEKRRLTIIKTDLWPGQVCIRYKCM